MQVNKYENLPKLVSFSFSLTKDAYEAKLAALLRNASVIDHRKSPCEANFVPSIQGLVFVVFIKMEEPTDFKTWLHLAKVNFNLRS